MDAERWQVGLGLTQYHHAFRQADIDAAVLPRLTGADLTALGATSVGHRLKLLAAIAPCPPPILPRPAR